MSSIQYKDSNWGLTVAFDFATELLRVSFSENIWLSLARVIVKAVTKVGSGIKDIYVKVNQLREAIIIDWEVSKARIQAGKLIEVTKEYEKQKLEVDNIPNLNAMAKQKLISRLDTALDLHIEKIIEYG